MRQGWNVLPPLFAVPVNRPERIARMNDKKRDYIIMTVATISILALLVLFYVVLSHFMI